VRPGLHPSDLAAVALLLISLTRPWSLKPVVQHNRVTGLLVALVALGSLTAPLALSPTLAAYTALRWLLALGVYLALAHSDGPARAWITALLVGVGLQVCLGIGQVVRQGPLEVPGELALPLHQAGAAVLTVGGRNWLRPYGLTFHPNVLGGYLAVGLLVSLPLLDRRWARPLWWLLGVGLLLTFSRSAWLATALVLPPVAAWLAWRRPEMRRPLVVTLGSAALIVLVVTGALAGQLLSRLRPETATEFRSLRERGELIGLALHLIAERPLAGVGAGNFALAARDAHSAAGPQPVHNVPLLLAAEVGLLGGVLWFWLWLAPGLAMLERLRDAEPWPLILAAAWFAWGVIGLWDGYPWALNTGRLLGASLLGLMGQAWAATPGSPTE
jgi:O-antigen ligase